MAFIHHGRNNSMRAPPSMQACVVDLSERTLELASLPALMQARLDALADQVGPQVA